MYAKVRNLCPVVFERRSFVRTRFIIRPRELFVRLEKTCDASHWTPTPSRLPTGIYGRFRALPRYRPPRLLRRIQADALITRFFFLWSLTSCACSDTQFIITRYLSSPIVDDNQLTVIATIIIKYFLLIDLIRWSQVYLSNCKSDGKIQRATFHLLINESKSSSSIQWIKRKKVL